MTDFDTDIDYSYDDIDENATYLIEQNHLDLIDVAQSSDGSKDLELDNLVFANNDGALTASVTHFTIQTRKHSKRLYFILRPVKSPENVGYAYAVRDADGLCVLIEETDPDMRQILHDWLEEELMYEELNEKPAAGSQKKKGAGSAILFILSLPFRLIFAFFKAILSLFGIAFGDTPFVRGFKKGFNGSQSEMKEYKITNELGCEQTVYSSDKKTFYHSDGSYAGTSDDGGKTIHS